jgi:hypothetical protein
MATEELTIEHVRRFAPYQLFQCVSPDGSEYLLELQEMDVDAAIEADVFHIKNLNSSDPVAVMDFANLKLTLQTIKTYVPCWTNTWDRLVH